MRAGTVGRSARVFRSVKLVFAPAGSIWDDYGSRGPKRNQGFQLDLYEDGLTAALNNRVHTVPYDNSTVLQNNLRHTGMTGFTEYEPQPQSCSCWSRSASPSIRSEPAGMRMYMSRAISLAVQ
ncbi:hypothetical protein AB0E82_20540 [Streptomyces anulatus]|uniref:hypothetical protein n=1 Tax=Streptomyces anulatus TaxID=1892 RepID=UPI0033D30B54